MKTQAGSRTDVGLTRRNNEDTYHADTERGIFIVADGMGGHAAGEVASQLAVEAVCAVLHSTAWEIPGLLLKQAVLRANQDVIGAAKRSPDWQGMGTTLTILLITSGQAFLAHVGDSRAYRVQNGRLEQLSQDHTLVGEQMRQGLLNEKEAAVSTLGHILLQAIGITPEPDIDQAEFNLAAGDKFLLCSDGLTDMLSDAEILAILQGDSPPEKLAGELISKALAAGGKDNVTVIVIEIDGSGKPDKR